MRGSISCTIIHRRIDDRRIESNGVRARRVFLGREPLHLAHADSAAQQPSESCQNGCVAHSVLSSEAPSQVVATRDLTVREHSFPQSVSKENQGEPWRVRRRKKRAPVTPYPHRDITPPRSVAPFASRQYHPERVTPSHTRLLGSAHDEQAPALLTPRA